MKGQAFMKNAMKWDVKINGSDYLIEYHGTNILGKVILIVNGEQTKYIPTRQSGQGSWVLFHCGRKECLMKIEPDKIHAEVYVNGKPISVTPIIEDADLETSDDHISFEAISLNRKVVSGAGSLLTILVLSVINVALTLFNAPLSFPFSIFSANFTAGMGIVLKDDFGSVALLVGLALSFTIIACYFVLYFFSFRSLPIVWIAFAFLIVDTLGLVVLGILSNDIISLLIDIAFHIWILWSILNLGIAKSKLKKLTLERISIHHNDRALEDAGR